MKKGCIVKGLITLGILVVVGLAGIVVVVVLFTSGTRRAQDADAQAGQPIVKAVYQFHGDHGKYPKSLADLTPYLPAPVDTNAWPHWDYNRSTWGGSSPGFALSKYTAGYKSKVIYMESDIGHGWSVMCEGGSTRGIPLPDMKSEE